MRSRLAVIVSAVAGVALAAPGIKDAPAKPDPLVGVWTLESVAFGGQVRPDPDALRWEFKSDGKYVKHRGEQRTEFRYSRDPKTDANAIDLDLRPDKPGTGVILGLYQVDGDKWTVALPQNRRTTRPTDFETPKDTEVAVYVFRRVKPKD